ncbi:MAG: hypothetical protein ACFFCS_09785, partial [Candidatus Hodarchaeota archaeon]
VIEPIFRSLLKFRFYKYKLTKMTGYMVLSVFLIPFMIGLSAIWASDKATLELWDYAMLLFFVLIFLALVPLLGSLDYRNRIEFTDTFRWQKVVKPALLSLLIAGFIFVILDILVMWFLDYGWPEAFDLLEQLIRDLL